jgi:hypothetical protein
MTWKSYIAVSVLGLVGTYMASSPLLPPRVAPAANPDSGVAAPFAAADIEREAARLEAGLRAEASFRAPTRNPFQFGERIVAAPAPPAVQASIDAAATLPPPSPEPPFIVLSGIATDVVDGATVRTAVLTTASGVTLARVGELVGPEYRVREIREDGVDLESVGDGSIRQLRFAIGPP